MRAGLRRSLFALGMAGCALPAPPIFADPVAVDAKTVVTAPDWVLGSTWYYSDGYALKVTSVTPGSTVFDRLDAPGQWFSRQGFLRKDLTSGTATRTSIFRTIPDQAGMALHAGTPLTFQREYLENGTLLVHASSWSVEGRETITVPAGTFDCWVIVWRSRSLRSDWTGFERWWYSPQAQNYVRMEYKYGPDAEGSRVLMRYQIGAAIAASAVGTPSAAPVAPAKIAAANRPSSPVVAPGPIVPPAPPVQQAVAVPAPPNHANPVAAVPPLAAPPPPPERIAAAPQHAGAASPLAGRTGGVWHAQVASSKDEAAVRDSLDKVLKDHTALLKDLPSGIVAARVGGRGIFHRAWLGEFDRSADAIALCDKLTAAGSACSLLKSSPGDGQKLASKL